VTPAVFAGFVEIKYVMGVLDGTDSVTPPHKAGDQFFDKGGFAGLGSADDTNNGRHSFHPEFAVSLSLPNRGPESCKKLKIENYVAKPILSSQMKGPHFNSIGLGRIPLFQQTAGVIDNLCLMIMVTQLWHKSLSQHSNR